MSSAPAAAVSPADRIARIPDPAEPVPGVAWPTVALFAGSLGTYAGATVLGVTGTWPWPLTTIVDAVCAFLLFTVSHDAAHNAVSTRGWVTTLLGRVATAAFAPHAGFRTWRFIHMQHHRFTNHDDGRDPDRYTHAGPRWQLLLRWATVDLFYMVFYLPQLRSRPRGEQRELVATWLVIGGAVAALIATGHLGAVLAFYLLPARLAVVFLAWSFDYLPHKGLEAHTPASNRFRATRNRVGSERVVSPLLLNQNYHLVHHLHPIIPFYRYVAVWRRGEEDYLAQDPALSTVRGRPLTPDEYRRLRAMASEH